MRAVSARAEGGGGARVPSPEESGQEEGLGARLTARLPPAGRSRRGGGQLDRGKDMQRAGKLLRPAQRAGESRRRGGRTHELLTRGPPNESGSGTERGASVDLPACLATLTDAQAGL
jgi:hypothetical protein